MKYDFDKVIQRGGSNSLKFDTAASHGMPGDLLPMWVADMDFQSPPGVIDALIEKCRYGIFGYSELDSSYSDAVRGWLFTHFGWKPEAEWLLHVPSIVFALSAIVRAMTLENESVLIQTPVYYPFTNMVVANKRNLVINELQLTDGKYRIDFQDFERKIAENNVKLFILCSPHNPIARVWTREELALLGEICLKYGVTVLADEIHADFVFPGNKHTVFAAIKPEFQDIAITCTSPAKSFNIAAMNLANVFIKDPMRRLKVRQEIARAGYTQPAIMGITACRAAYLTGEEWLNELKVYLKSNVDYMRKFIKECLPELTMIEPEGTYLMWLDCRKLGMTDSELEDFIVNKARLWLDSGYIFGKGGEGFQRVNIGCPRAILKDALERLEKAIISIRK